MPMQILENHSGHMVKSQASERVRLRLKEELNARRITQRTLADMLTQQTGERWTQAGVGKVLNGDVRLTVDDVEAISKACGIFLTEAVRDRGLEFYAEMTPSELRVLEVFRQRPPAVRQAFMTLLGIQSPTESSSTVPKRAKLGRPMNSEIAKRNR